MGKATMLAIMSKSNARKQEASGIVKQANHTNSVQQVEQVEHVRQAKQAKHERVISERQQIKANVMLNPTSNTYTKNV